MTTFTARSSGSGRHLRHLPSSIAPPSLRIRTPIIPLPSSEGMDSPLSPSSTSRKGSIDSIELDRYFATYVPPSNLPTPPPSPGSKMVKEGTMSHRLSGPVSESLEDLYGYVEEDEVEEEEEDEDEEEDEEATGLGSHADYLANALPRHASRYRPNPLIIHSFLLRSSLPIETVALASCILASLSPSFLPNFREKCQNSGSRPSSPSSPTSASSFPTGSSSSETGNQFPDAFPTFHPTQGSSSNPDLIVLASLLLANAFLDDGRTTLKSWSEQVGSGLYTEKQIGMASDVMLRDLGYRLWGFEEPVRLTVEDMTRRGSGVRFRSMTW